MFCFSADRMFHPWRHFWVTIRSNGTCRWQPGGNFAFTCALDMNLYPFDEQVCTMEIETWYYTSDKVRCCTRLTEYYNMEPLLLWIFVVFFEAGLARGFHEAAGWEKFLCWFCRYCRIPRKSRLILGSLWPSLCSLLHSQLLSSHVVYCDITITCYIGDNAVINDVVATAPGSYIAMSLYYLVKINSFRFTQSSPPK